jgi:hypothetical protein
VAALTQRTLARTQLLIQRRLAGGVAARPPARRRFCIHRFCPQRQRAQ